MKKIPRIIAYDMLFGQNNDDVHSVIHRIYDSMEERCDECQHYVASKTSQQFGHCLRTSLEPSMLNTVEDDWYCKGIRDG